MSRSIYLDSIREEARREAGRFGLQALLGTGAAAARAWDRGLRASMVAERLETEEGRADVERIMSAPRPAPKRRKASR